MGRRPMAASAARRAAEGLPCGDGGATDGYDGLWRDAEAGGTVGDDAEFHGERNVATGGQGNGKGDAGNALTQGGDGAGTLEDYAAEEPAARIVGEMEVVLQVAVAQASQVVASAVGNAGKVMRVVFYQGLLDNAEGGAIGHAKGEIPILKRRQGGIQEDA